MDNGAQAQHQRRQEQPGPGTPRRDTSLACSTPQPWTRRARTWVLVRRRGVMHEASLQRQRHHVPPDLELERALHLGLPLPFAVREEHLHLAREKVSAKGPPWSCGRHWHAISRSRRCCCARKGAIAVARCGVDTCKQSGTQGRRASGTGGCVPAPAAAAGQQLLRAGCTLASWHAPRSVRAALRAPGPCSARRSSCSPREEPPTAGCMPRSASEAPARAPRRSGAPPVGLGSAAQGASGRARPHSHPLRGSPRRRQRASHVGCTPRSRIECLMHGARPLWGPRPRPSEFSAGS